jgi:hypothetical protein
MVTESVGLVDGEPKGEEHLHLCLPLVLVGREVAYIAIPVDERGGVRGEI